MVRLVYQNDWHVDTRAEKHIIVSEKKNIHTKSIFKVNKAKPLVLTGAADLVLIILYYNTTI